MLPRAAHHISGTRTDILRCVAQNLLLVAKAQHSEEIMTTSLQKLETFERDMRLATSREV